MAKAPFRSSNHFVFRTPLLPLKTYFDWSAGITAAERVDTPELGDVMRADCAMLRERLRVLVARKEVREALFISSPDLEESLEEWIKEPDSQRGQKVERSLIRYFTRMTYRCTPFGTCSGVSVGKVVGNQTQIEMLPISEYERHTRIDNDYLFALTLHLEADAHVRERLLFYPNSSLYDAAGRLRYAEARLMGRTRSYHLVAVEPTDYLMRTLERAQTGAREGDLAHALTEDDPEIALDEAREFIGDLIASQLLVSKFTPAVTGRQPIEGILEGLAAWAPGSTAESVMQAVNRSIGAISGKGIGSSPDLYRDVAKQLEALPIPVTISRLFQVDMHKPVARAELGGKLLAEIERGLALLASMSPAGGGGQGLDQFRKDFNERWEGLEVPLTLALDEEVGIGFNKSNAPGAEASPLLAGIGLGGRREQDNRVAWGKREAVMFDILLKSIAAGTQHVELSKDDIARLKVDKPSTLCDSFSSMPTVLAASLEDIEKGNFQIVLEGASGPDGERISGRFCHINRSLEEGVKESLKAEEALIPDAIFAEIVHLPQGRMGNILCRPVLRDYEITYLGLSGAPEDNQIPIQDLMVSVRDNQIILRSKRLNKRIIPRMTTAHNYRGQNLGVYQFLCTLQGQEGGSAGFGWGSLAKAPFLPRITHGRYILSPATWNLSGRDIEPLEKAMEGSKAAKTPDKIQALRERIFVAAQALRKRLRMPRYVVQVDADNTLLVDLDNPLSVESWASMIKSRGEVELQENLVTPDNVFIAGPEGKFANEFVVSYTSNREPTRTPQIKPRNASLQPAKRDFIPDSPWLYMKIYTGTATADDVIRRALIPVVEQAKEEGAIKHWFFIRYSDPDWHLRLRFHGDPAAMRESVLARISPVVETLIGEGVARKVVLDTYERETDRYGGPHAIELAEQLWCNDSEAVTAIVALLEGDAGADARWRLSVRGTDQLLDDLGLDMETKLRVLRQACEMLGSEFGVGRDQQTQLGDKFRSLKADLAVLLDRNPEVEAESELLPGFEAFYRRSERNKPIVAELRKREAAGELVVPIVETAWSHVHMHCNRLLRSAARAQELVIYDLLKRWYEMKLALAKQAAKKSQPA